MTFLTFYQYEIFSDVMVDRRSFVDLTLQDSLNRFERQQLLRHLLIHKSLETSALSTPGTGEGKRGLLPNCHQFLGLGCAGDFLGPLGGELSGGSATHSLD